MKKTKKNIGRILASFLPNKEFKFHSFKNGILILRDRSNNKPFIVNWDENPNETDIEMGHWGVSFGNSPFISFHEDDSDTRKPENHPMVRKEIEKIWNN